MWYCSRLTSEMIQEKDKFHSYLVRDLYQRKATKGEIGIELETIGKNLPEVFNDTPLWGIHNDDSVKPREGEMAKEYVLNQPISRGKVSEALQALQKEWTTSKSEIAEGRISNSVHIHINAQTLTIQQVYTWLALYYLFEELLVRWAGNDRVANLFCLRARDAEAVIQLLKDSARKDNFISGWNSTNYRYAAANICALPKFGSLEFRALRGTGKIDVINAWVEMLLAIKDKSLKYRDPVHVLSDFSQRSPFGLIRHVFPEQYRSIFWSQSDFQDVMYTGSHLVQDFAHATKWQGRVHKPEPKERKAMYTSDFEGFLDTQAFVSSNTTIVHSNNIWDTSQPQPAIAPNPGVHSSVTRSYRLIKKSSSFVDPTEQEIHDGATRIFKLKQTIQDWCKNSGFKVGFQTYTESTGTVRRYLAFMRVSDNGFVDWVRHSSMVQQ